jgi:hypothetical protein
MSRGVRLTPAVAGRIVGFILAGGFPHVAAAAAGVPAEVFADWLERGRERGARAPYRSLVRQVEEAAAQARLKAEVEIREKDPRFWLRHGPGRETPDAPGWTAPARPETATAGSEGNRLLESPEWDQVWRAMWGALEAFPEARAALAEALRQLPMILGKPRQPTGKRPRVP